MIKKGKYKKGISLQDNNGNDPEGNKNQKYTN